MNWYLAVLKKYAVFSGRAHRTEYWMFTLFNLLFGIVFSFLASVLNLFSLDLVYGLAVVLPTLAVSVRRFHDTGRSAWWVSTAVVLQLLVAAVGPDGAAGGLYAWRGLGSLIIGAVVIAILVQDSQPGPNKYGPNPKTAG